MWFAQAAGIVIAAKNMDGYCCDTRVDYDASDRRTLVLFCGDAHRADDALDWQEAFGGFV